MSTVAHAARLRVRVDDLRRFAGELERTPATRLDAHAGDHTWRGQRPHLCRLMLHVNLRQLHEAAEELRWQALLLERQAEELEQLARLGEP